MVGASLELRLGQTFLNENHGFKLLGESKKITFFMMSASFVFQKPISNNRLRLSAHISAAGAIYLLHLFVRSIPFLVVILFKIDFNSFFYIRKVINIIQYRQVLLHSKSYIWYFKIYGTRLFCIFQLPTVLDNLYLSKP